MPQDILIVDDQRPELRIFGNSIQLRLNIEPFLADDPLQALEILKNYQIKVLVVDYNLESSMNGLDLVKKVQDELGLQMPCIMVTGQTESVNIREAVERFFSFIDKGDVSAQLADAVRDGLRKYKADEQFRLSFPVDQLLVENRSLVRFNTRVSARLTRINNIDESYVQEDDWETFENALQNLTHSHEKKVRRKVAFAQGYGVTSTLSETLNLTIGKLLGGVKSATEGRIVLDAKIQNTQEFELEATQRIEVTTLSGEPGPDNRVLKSIEFQAAPAYVRIDAVVEVDCNCCQIPKRDDATFLVPTTRMALRQVEHFDTGPKRTIWGGFLNGSIVSSRPSP